MIDFFTLNLRETSCKIYSAKSIFKGTLLTDDFLSISDLFYIIAMKKSILIFGTFGHRYVYYVIFFTSFLSNANTVILVDQMTISTGEIEALKCSLTVNQPL